MLLDPPRANHSELWSRLEALDLDGAAPLSFSHRLARDNGWTPDFARRVVLEYKKFVFLAATCGHPVTPSDEVDQAWHQHLIYTRSYWEELCGEILGFALHHGPLRVARPKGRSFGTGTPKPCRPTTPLSVPCRPPISGPRRPCGSERPRIFGASTCGGTGCCPGRGGLALVLRKPGFWLWWPWYWWAAPPACP
ncbi:glycine-rich domain-containing protein [Hymenobacter cellulosilyticus]|uniref:Uncharacterized protein n=1 Tax=Hymenobacter cellulosilyticus TaxID=2932248 RepID=A0A8T9PX72_9BACT|nr:hypothetical protein [Hymenobacter cellulosilyticus]UOQ69976.1 hypothetical protein MUN79_14355 [Hymenobacter cellulosilyticus]